jgi:Protein of unknown function (DUF3140)
MIVTDSVRMEALPAPREFGERVARLLRKRKVDLTGDDAEAMRQVVDLVEDPRAGKPPAGARGERWRRSLMTVGHDPLKPRR